MLKKAELKDEIIIRCLRDEYGLSIENVSFLPLGADRDTSVYRVVTQDESNYFVKLKKGDFNEASVTIPNFLSALGIKQVIPALTTQTGQVWANLNPYKVILYPFMEGQPAFEAMMSNQKWIEYGTALKRFHTSDIPANMTSNIQKDKFSPRWRNKAKRFLTLIEKETFNHRVAIEIAEFLKSKKDKTLEILKRAEQLAQMLQEQPPEFILTHGDIHGWNLFIDASGALYIVDWDGLIFAPKERDLMFIGGGHGDSGYTPQEEAIMFYQGYGQTKINHMAMAYYRYERTIEDMVDNCDQIFFSDRAGEVGKEVLEDLKSMFLPNGKVEMAYQSDKVFNSS